VTSLGLVQMTRKRIGTGLLESFSHECEACKGRGVVVTAAPVEAKKEESRQPAARNRRGGRGRGAKPQGAESESDQSSEKPAEDEQAVVDTVEPVTSEDLDMPAEPATRSAISDGDLPEGEATS